jgi:hypothetical protein
MSDARSGSKLESHRSVLDKDPNLLKVRIIAPNLESDGYEGWTDVQTLGSEPDVAK